MSYALAIPNSAFKMKTRNELASAVIVRYAKRHRLIDMVIGGVGSLTPVPGAGVAATVAAIAAQAPVVYQPMVKDLAYIYSTSPDRITRGMVIDATVTGAVGDVGYELISEFGQAFLLELIQDILPELGASAVVGAIPVAGILATAYLDARLAATLTWEVGVMTAIYFMNDEDWVEGSKRETRDTAKKIVGRGTKIRNRANLDTIPSRVPEVEEKIVGALVQNIGLMRESNPEITQDRLRAIFKQKQIPDQLIEEALRRVFLQG